MPDISPPAHVLRALNMLEGRGYSAYAVGGCIRDRLLGREPQDWDLCTAALPGEILSVFAGERTIPTGIEHGTVTLLTDAGPLEITTFRRDGGYSDSRHPDRVEFVDAVELDLSRRDFTVNAMAWSPSAGLRDPFGGQEDLRRGLIRAVGVPELRFGEDALRILRALRFAARYGFAVEEKTAAALRARRGLLAKVSRERVFSEVCGLLPGDGAGEVLLAFPEVVFAAVPELTPMLGLDQAMPARHCWDVWGHTARAVEAIAPERTLRLAALLHDCGKPVTASRDPVTGEGRFYGHPAAGAVLADRILRSLRCDNAARQRVTTLIRYHGMPFGHGEAAIRTLWARLGEDALRSLLELRRADALAHAPAARPGLLSLWEEDCRALERVRALGLPRSVRELSVSGGELLALGYPKGKPLGETLTELWEETVRGDLPNEKQALLHKAEKRKNVYMQGGRKMEHNITVTWLGHSCFRLAWEGHSLVIDPYAPGSVPGCPALQVTAGAVFCSHEHRDHGAREVVSLDGTGLGEDFSVEEIRCPHDHHNGERRGMNIIRCFHIGKMRIVHLGDVGCPLPEETVRRLRGCDLLLLPVGGYYTVNGAEAFDLWERIAPRCGVPMHYRSEAPAFGYPVLSTLEDFLRLVPQERITLLEEASFQLTKDSPAGIVVPAFEG